MTLSVTVHTFTKFLSSLSQLSITCYDLVRPYVHKILIIVEPLSSVGLTRPYVHKILVVIEPLLSGSHTHDLNHAS
jgi:hypothetical protein